MKELFKFIEGAVQTTLENDVANHAKDVLKDKIQTVVYDQYDPTEYERKYSNGGLLDDENIEIKKGKGSISIRSTRTNDDDTDGRDGYARGTKDVASILETGTGYTWTRSAIYQMQPYPRPFHYETFLEMQKTLSHVDALKRGLKRLGISVL